MPPPMALVALLSTPWYGTSSHVIKIQRGFVALRTKLAASPLPNVIRHLLACARFALRPVCCGANLFASPVTPNRTGGAGPVFCGSIG